MAPLHQARESSNHYWRHAPAIAAFAAALLAIVLIVPYNMFGPAAYWLILNTLKYACAIFALLALRRSLLGRAGARQTRLGMLLICGVYVLLPITEALHVISVSVSIQRGAALYPYRAMIALSLMIAVLYIYLAIRMWQARLPDSKFLLSFATMAALGFVMPHMGSDFWVSAGLGLRLIAYITMGMYLLRHPADDGTGQGEVDHVLLARMHGARNFAGIVLGVAAFAALIASVTMAWGPVGFNIVAVVAMLLLAPAISTTEALNLPEHVGYFFLFSLVYLPLLLLPLGVRLILNPNGRLWVMVLVQSVFVIVYAIISIGLMISGIRM